MKLKTVRYNKEYQLIDNSIEVARIIKPKWYLSDIEFYLKNKTVLIEKTNFWGTYYNIIEMGDSIGKIECLQLKFFLMDCPKVCKNHTLNICFLLVLKHLKQYYLIKLKS